VRAVTRCHWSQEKLEKAKGIVLQLRESESALKRTNEQLSSELAASKHKLQQVGTQMQQTIVDLRSQNGILEQEITSLRVTVHEQAAQVTTQTNADEAHAVILKERVQELERALQDAKAEVATVSSEKVGVPTYIYMRTLDGIFIINYQEGLRTEVVHFKSEVATLESTLQLVRDENAQLLQQVNNVTARCGQLESEINGLVLENKTRLDGILGEVSGRCIVVPWCSNLFINAAFV
jgi:chromosome segregation ATPase